MSIARAELTEDDIAAIVRDRIADAGGVRKLAEKLGVSPSYVCDLKEGRRLPGPKILGHLGIECVRTVAYYRVRRVANNS